VTPAAEARKARLGEHVARQAAEGWRIESQDDFRAVMVRGRRIERREIVAIDETGALSIERLPLDKVRIALMVAFALAVVLIIALAVVFGDDPSDEGSLVLAVARLNQGRRRSTENVRDWTRRAYGAAFFPERPTPTDEPKSGRPRAGRQRGWSHVPSPRSSLSRAGALTVACTCQTATAFRSRARRRWPGLQ
jgi:hypothetical protein